MVFLSIGECIADGIVDMCLGSVSFAFSLSEDEVQRDTQLCVDHAMMAVNVSNMIAILFFLSLLAILNLMMSFTVYGLQRYCKEMNWQKK